MLFGTLRRGLVKKDPIPAAGEVVIPRLLFEISSERMRSAAGDAVQGPEVIEIIAGVAPLAFAVGGGGHFRKEVRSLAVPEQIEEHSGGGAFAVVFVGGVGEVITVGDGPFVDPPAEESGRLCDG